MKIPRVTLLRKVNGYGWRPKTGSINRSKRPKPKRINPAIRNTNFDLGAFKYKARPPTTATAPNMRYTKNILFTNLHFLNNFHWHKQSDPPGNRLHYLK
jgi:hypothetical protein